MIRRALRLGIGLSGRNGGLLFVVWLINLLVALVLLRPMYGLLHDSFGHSLAADRMAVGFDYRWHHEFRFQNRGDLARSFKPSLIGAGAVLDNLETFLTNRFDNVPPVLLATAALYLFLIAVVTGGVVARFHKPGGRLKLRRVFSNGIRFTPRFLFLAAIVVGGYYLVFHYPVRYLDKLNERLLLDMTWEPAALILDWWKIILTAVMLGFLFMIADYARIATVVKERSNPLRALWDALLFFFRRPGSCVGLYLTLNLMGVAIIAAYGLTAWLARSWTPWGIAAIFGLGQLLIVARLWLRLTAYSSQMALFKTPPPPTAAEKKEPVEPAAAPVDKGVGDEEVKGEVE